jgi:hypothetical protein
VREAQPLDAGKQRRTHLDFLLEAALDEVVTGQPDVLARRQALEGDLVLVRLLELLAVEDLVDDALLALDDDVGALLHLHDLLLSQLLVGLLQLLEVLSGLVALEEVFCGWFSVDRD